MFNMLLCEIYKKYLLYVAFPDLLLHIYTHFSPCTKCSQKVNTPAVILQVKARGKRFIHPSSTKDGKYEEGNTVSRKCNKDLFVLKKQEDEKKITGKQNINQNIRSRISSNSR